MMKVIGITGPTGAGKTSALLLMQEMDGVDWRTIDCDDVYHRLLRDDENLRRELTDQFGDEILDEDGNVDRKKLAGQVFGSPGALEKLDAVTSPYIVKEVDRLVSEAEADGADMVAIDAVALFESGLADRCQYTIAVSAPDEERLKRIMEREGISEEYARSRMDAQHDNMWYWKNCDFVLMNDKNEEKFGERGKTLFEYVAELAPKHSEEKV